MKKPLSIKIALGLLVVVAAVQGIAIVRLLMSSSADALTRGGVDLAIRIALIALVIAVWRWIGRRDSRARWGLLVLIALGMGRVGLALPANVESPDARIGAMAMVIIVWVSLLVLGWRIVFSRAVKAFFAPAPPEPACPTPKP